MLQEQDIMSIKGGLLQKGSLEAMMRYQDKDAVLIALKGQK